MTLAHWYYVVEYKPRTRLLSAEELPWVFDPPMGMKVP
jgi:hypothetical protein